MKKVTLVLLALLLAGCGKDLSTRQGTYSTYGLFNQQTAKSRNVCYEVSAGNVVWSILLIETVVFPVYFVGFSIFNPVRMKRTVDDDCGVD